MWRDMRGRGAWGFVWRASRRWSSCASRMMARASRRGTADGSASGACGSAQPCSVAVSRSNRSPERAPRSWRTSPSATYSASMPRIRVLVADDHAVLRAGLKLLINAQSDMEVVGEAGSGPESVHNAQTTMPHVVLLDLSMPGTRSTHTIEQLARAAPEARVLVLTMHDDPAYMRAALVAGASGYIVKQAAAVELLTAIRAVHHGPPCPPFGVSHAPGRPGPARSGRAGLPRLPRRRAAQAAEPA